MSGFKMRFLLSASMLLPMAAAPAALAVETERAAAVATGPVSLELTAAQAKTTVAVMAAAFPWSRKWHKHRPV